MSARRQLVKRTSIAVLAATTATAPVTRADEAALQKKIAELEKRIAELEGKSTQVVTQASVPAKTLEFLGQTQLSGFVSGSYIYDFSKPSRGGISPRVAGRLYDSDNNAFTPDKFKLALERPIEFHPDKWAAGYRADLIVGKDAETIHSTGWFGGPGSSQSIDLEQAYVNFNVPVGNGLQVLVGKHVTMMGVEVIEEVDNPNWSVGNQFIYLENATETGVRLSYKWNDHWLTDFCVINGWDQVTDGNSSKSFMGRVTWTIDDQETIAVLGYGGPEEADDNHDWRTGTDVVFNRKWNAKLNSWLQLDYGHEDNAPVLDGSGTTVKNADWYGAGLWLTYDFTDKIGLAARGDYLKDKNGARTPSTAGAPITTFATFSDVPKELSSATLTLNLKPLAGLQVRPEVRYDRAASAHAFNGRQDQFTAALGVAYLY